VFHLFAGFDASGYSLVVVPESVINIVDGAAGCATLHKHSWFKYRHVNPIITNFLHLNYCQRNCYRIGKTERREESRKWPLNSCSPRSHSIVRLTLAWIGLGNEHPDILKFSPTSNRKLNASAQILCQRSDDFGLVTMITSGGPEFGSIHPNGPNERDEPCQLFLRHLPT
jgi:hypothetical protein